MDNFFMQVLCNTSEVFAPNFNMQMFPKQLQRNPPVSQNVAIVLYVATTLQKWYY